jgi:hypothetical protein
MRPTSVSSLVLFALFLATFTITEHAYCQDDCFRPPDPVENLDDVRDFLILQTPRKANYVIRSSCCTLARRTFSTVLSFGILNRFPDGTGITDGYVLIKSYRILTSSPSIKISLSRGDDWFLPLRGRTTAAAPRIDSEPFGGSIEAWNAAHASEGTPTEVDERLKIFWHAFARNDLTMPSTVPSNFWEIDSTFDRIHGVRTNYLVRFGVNTKEAKASIVPFQVYAQREVQQITLSLWSNIDALSGDYKFVIK